MNYFQKKIWISLTFKEDYDKKLGNFLVDIKKKLVILQKEDNLEDYLDQNMDGLKEVKGEELVNFMIGTPKD